MDSSGGSVGNVRRSGSVSSTKRLSTQLEGIELGNPPKRVSGDFTGLAIPHVGSVASLELRLTSAHSASTSIADKRRSAEIVRRMMFNFPTNSVSSNANSDSNPSLNADRNSDTRSSNHVARTRTAPLWMSAPTDKEEAEIDDSLAKSQRIIKDLKSQIGIQSKKNFVLERDLRYLDGRIALLIQNRLMADANVQEITTATDETQAAHTVFDERHRQLYGQLFFLLQNEPKYIADVVRMASLAEADQLTETIMFTIFGNQYDTREEYLLLSMFQHVLVWHFESNTEFNNLLRANTTISRLLTTYTRRGPGQAYLKATLSQLIGEILAEEDLDLEIDPLKVYTQLAADLEAQSGKSTLPTNVTQEEAAAHPQIQAIIAPRARKVMAIAKRFLDVIIGSLDQVPYGLRWICKVIASLCKRKYPDVSSHSICALIGGLFFLRFINPAIITPQAYMLVESPLTKNPRRVLVLVAKLIQNVANKPSYAKETYMMVTNSFVEENKDRMNTFLNSLGEVGDFHEALEMDQYMALSRRELTLHITMNELYGTHDLLQRYRSQLLETGSNHLSIILNDLGPAPEKVPRSENRTVVLPIYPRFEGMMGVCLSSSGASGIIWDGKAMQDMMYINTKSKLVRLLRQVPSYFEGLRKVDEKGVVSYDVDLDALIDFCLKSDDPSLVQKATSAQIDLVKLCELHVINKEDKYQFLREEVSQELVHLGSLKTRLQQELTQLETVFSTIKSHNAWLESQLDTFKAYLANVREQTGKLSRARLRKSNAVFKFTHDQWLQDGVVVTSTVPDQRRPGTYFTITSPTPSSFLLSMFYKGRDKAIVEMDLKLDDLLEGQQNGTRFLEFEFVKLSVFKFLGVINKTFFKR